MAMTSLNPLFIHIITSIAIYVDIGRGVEDVLWKFDINQHFIVTLVKGYLPLHVIIVHDFKGQPRPLPQFTIIKIIFHNSFYNFKTRISGLQQCHMSCKCGAFGQI